GKRFYVGTVPEKVGDIRTKKAMSNQTTLFTILKKNNWEIKTSKLRTRLEEIPIDSRVVDYQKLQKLGIKKITFERLREKGIDVKLATDLIVGAVDNQYDTAVLISSDSDLIPAIDWVRFRKKKKIEYVGFSIPDEENPKNSTNPLISLIAKTDIKRTLVKSDLQPFIKQTLFQNKQ
ncbi:MAG: NYN domain-containing protein, partial [bacterium]|nr:NYN domain-containing protein [bacterium]